MRHPFSSKPQRVKRVRACVREHPSHVRISSHLSVPDSARALAGRERRRQPTADTKTHLSISLVACRTAGEVTCVIYILHTPEIKTPRRDAREICAGRFLQRVEGVGCVGEAGECVCVRDSGFVCVAFGWRTKYGSCKPIAPDHRRDESHVLCISASAACVVYCVLVYVLYQPVC